MMLDWLLRLPRGWPPLAIALLLSACTRETSPATESVASPRAAKVRWFGALHEIMAEQKTEARVRIAEASAGPHTFGVGVLAELRGEVTILDDVAWIARPSGDGTASVSSQPVRDAQDGAALLVVADVESWRELTIVDDVQWGELDTYLAAQVEAHGFAAQEPVPVVIRGPFADLRWHVLAGPAPSAADDHAAHLEGAITGRIPAASVPTTLVGFFSRRHAGVFTHHDSYSHFHVVSAGDRVAAHVDGVVLRSGARLRLPAR